ncbi:hypothetical protein L596_017075 [Steinernema carpocapsae]|uniref:Uncharacterized protein n=1 Tax=Steinernema carpocapsae TaxID=34508 RepID=A0A4U5N0G5_STECR|nr:hypothetical protein L596_017075 [Steinernema carpocapsae]
MESFPKRVFKFTPKNPQSLFEIALQNLYRHIYRTDNSWDRLQQEEALMNLPVPNKVKNEFPKLMESVRKLHYTYLSDLPKHTGQHICIKNGVVDEMLTFDRLLEQKCFDFKDHARLALRYDYIQQFGEGEDQMLPCEQPGRYYYTIHVSRDEEVMPEEPYVPVVSFEPEEKPETVEQQETEHWTFDRMMDVLKNGKRL